MSQVLTSILLLLGGGFCLLGAVGMVRMPDIFTRLQAATKTGTLGVGFIMLATAIHFQDLGVSVRSLLVILFLFLTAPIAAHVIARAAYFVASPLWSRTAVDELKRAVELRKAAAAAAPPDTAEDKTPDQEADA